MRSHRPFARSGTCGPCAATAPRTRLRLPGTTPVDADGTDWVYHAPTPAGDYPPRASHFPGGQRTGGVHTATIFETVNRHLRERGLLLNRGTLTDATILAAPPSTKNEEKARDPQMHQTREGIQWTTAKKAHIRADTDSELVHTVVGTAANFSDVTQTEHLLHGEE